MTRIAVLVIGGIEVTIKQCVYHLVVKLLLLGIIKNMDTTAEIILIVFTHIFTPFSVLEIIQQVSLVDKYLATDTLAGTDILDLVLSHEHTHGMF